jgi:hypothetical protein
VLDMLGGTMFMPDRMPQKYGTDDPVPPLYHQQLAYPFVGKPGHLARGRAGRSLHRPASPIDLLLVRLDPVASQAA